MKAIKVWIIIGMILTPAAIGGPIMRVIPSPQNLVVLLLYAITVPLGIYTLKKLKKAKCRQDVIGVGILCIFLVSLIGGILILASDDKIYQNNSRNTDLKTKSNIEHSVKTTTDEEIKKEFIDSFQTKNNEFMALFSSHGIKNEEELETILEEEYGDGFEKYYFKANCYIRGLIYKKDMHKAFINYQRASDLGHGESSYAAGMFCILGIGTNKNKKDAEFYINRGMFQKFDMAKKYWNENIDLGYNFHYKNENISTFKSIKEKYEINDKDIELNELLDHLINVVYTQEKVENEKDLERLTEIISFSIDNIIKNIDIIYKDKDRRQKLVAALDLTPYTLVRENSDAEFKEQIKIYEKYFGKSMLMGLVEPGDSNLTFISRHCALIYREIKKIYSDAYNFEQLLYLTITVNMSDYVLEKKLTTSMLDEVAKWSKKLTLISESGSKYIIPENDNDEISQASIIAVYCIYLICSIDNQEIPNKTIIEYVISNYFAIKENVTKIFNNQLNSTDKIYKTNLNQAIKKVMKEINEGDLVYDA